MRIAYVILMSIIVLSASAPPAAAGILNSAEDFTVLGSAAVTNTGVTSVTGDLGVYPGSSITGTGSLALAGTLHVGDDDARQAQDDVTKAYNGLQAMTPNQNLTGQNLGGMTLTSGVYTFENSAQLTGTLTLDAQGNNNAFWVFQIGSTLTTASAVTGSASASGVQITNPGSNGETDYGLFWQIGSSATLGTYSAFEGNLLALTSITLDTGATIHNGRALAENGVVIMDSNTISQFSPPPDYGTLSGGLAYDSLGNVVPAAPEPASFVLLASGILVLCLLRKQDISVTRKTTRGI